MISPDVLKNSGMAGVLGAVVIGGAMLMTPEFQGLDENLETDTRVEVHQTRYAPDPDPTIAKIEAAPGASDGRREVKIDEAREARIEARNRAARQALDKLDDIYGHQNRHGEQVGKADVTREQVRDAYRKALQKTQRRFNDRLILEGYRGSNHGILNTDTPGPQGLP